MLHYDYYNLANLWVANGGNPDARAIAAGVATAESGGYIAAISPSSDYGLWQINSIHFGSVGINANNWEDPNVNARAAIAISANGSNWAPWCTCWANPGGNCGHGYLPTPQPGSPAYQPWREAAAVLMITGGAAAAVIPATGIGHVAQSWAELRDFVGGWARIVDGQYQSAIKGTGGMRR